MTIAAPGESARSHCENNPSTFAFAFAAAPQRGVTKTRASVAMARGRAALCEVVIGCNLAKWIELANGNSQCPRPDLHRHFAHFKYAVSALDYAGKSGAGIWSVQTGDRITSQLIASPGHARSTPAKASGTA